MTAPTERAAPQKARSRNYPAFGLNEALEKVRQLYERDGKAAVPREVAVQAWGYKGLNGASLRALGALNQYGLLDSPGQRTVKLSDRALTILLEPEDSPLRATAIREAANTPAVFSELQTQYPDGLPSDAALVSHLVRNLAFSEEAAKGLIAAFRDTLELVERVAPRNITRGAAGADPKEVPPQGVSRTHAPPGVSHMEFTWPLSGDATATLTVTRTLEPDDIETLTAYFEIAKKALTKAAATRVVQPPDAQPEA